METGGPGKNRISSVVYVFAALMVISLSMLFVSTRGFAAPFKNFGLSVFSGVRGGVHGVTSLVSRTILSIQELATYRQEYNELLSRMARYEQLERGYAEIDQENNRLREQLGFSQSLRYRHIPAEFIGRDPNNLYSALVINKGQYAGVTTGMTVIAWQHGAQALVGKVIQAGLLESLVMPLYDSNSFVSARLAVSRYEGMVEGTGTPDQPLLMRYIQKRAKDEINTGDVVVTSGIGGVFPAGINIGRVVNVNYEEYEISMQVELEPIIDFSRLEYVFVIGAEPADAANNTTNDGQKQ
ncbi:MAG: rod shape-determining protein MreC [Treponema sp.]|nr:rod shape-determining protein MreC [Treponema sp.]